MNEIRRHLRAFATVGTALGTVSTAIDTVRTTLATLGTKALRAGLRWYRIGTGRPPSSIRQARFVGATERFGAELRAMRHMQVSPELVSDIETELQWGLIWHDFERLMQAEIDKVFAPYLAMAECEDFEELRDLVGLADVEPVESHVERDAVLV
jgi:hypothetical protein